MCIIMDENNPKVQDEKIINHKCNCIIIARLVKGAKQFQRLLKLITNDNQLHIVANALVRFWGISFNFQLNKKTKKTMLLTLNKLYQS